MIISIYKTNASKFFGIVTVSPKSVKVFESKYFVLKTVSTVFVAPIMEQVRDGQFY